MSVELDMLGVAVAVLDVTAVRAHGDVHRLRVQRANARCLALYGASTLAELQAHLVPALADVAGLLEGLRGSERTIEVDVAMRSVSGEPLQLALVLAPLAWRDDRAVVVLTVLDRAPVVRRIEESEQRFRIMADFAPVLLWMSGTDGLCYFFNKGWLEFTGRTIEQERGNGWAEGVYAEDFQRCMTTYLDAFVARLPFRMEYRLRRADGAYRWVLDTGTPRITPDGAFAGYIGSCIDITEIKAVHAELDARVQSRTSELTAAMAELEAFCYSVSHDLRAPLRGIDGFSQAVLEDNAGKLDARSHDHLQRVRAAAQRMGRLIDDLLKLSRFSRGELRTQQVDLSALARTIVSELAELEPERRVRVAIEDGLIAHGDPTLLRAVLENLLGNAWKFTRTTAEPAIALGVEAGPARVYYVRDNGVGFSMEHAGALFAPFQRLHAERDFPGTGIGLASAQRIIQRHGGRIWVDAAEGAGACFRWTLPRGRGPS